MMSLRIHPPCAPRVGGVLAGRRITAVAAGANHTVVLSDEGLVFTFGDGSCGQLGHGDARDCLSPRQVAMVRPCRITVVAAVALNTLALTDGAQVLLWGADGGASPVPVDFGGANMTKLYSGCDAHHMAASADDGTLYMWGRGEDGQLGYGANVSLGAPPVGSHVVRVKDVALALGHTLAITSQGALFAWGCVCVVVCMYMYMYMYVYV